MGFAHLALFLAIPARPTLTITFGSAVSNLNFWLDGSNAGDSLALSVFGLGNALLATLNFTVPDQLIDLSAYGTITRSGL